METIAYEINFDGLAGMTHHFGGLSYGNIPSITNAGTVSRPKQAALQGLNKMKLMHSLGVKQAVFPPHERPYIPSLKHIGFSGTPTNILKEAERVMPWFLPHISSSSAMWTANSCTVSPSIDCSDNHVHFTIANLATHFHRAIETKTTSAILKAIFPNPVFFTHHNPLLDGEIFFDEGSANHIRFCNRYHSPGVHLFVYGKMVQPTDGLQSKPEKFPARQTREASEAVNRLHQHFPKHAIFAQQHPDAIDAGAFHNDLISFGNQNIFIVHEKAFWKQQEVLSKLKTCVSETCDTELNINEISENELPLQEAISTYFFNSLLITLQDGSYALIIALQCQQSEIVMKVIKKIIDDPNIAIRSFHTVDLKESMQNGGGPACLRLKVVLNEQELAEVNPQVLYTERLHERLVEYVMKHYPDTLTIKDLTNPALYEKNCNALHELTKILNLGKIYSFQQ